MQLKGPSRTARGAAVHRAVHQKMEGGAIFADAFAATILDDQTRASLDEAAGDLSQRPMRLFIAARSRFSEERLAACVGRGAHQIVVLGAGLDTFALRNAHASLSVRVFEVDHPATQQWKRERLKDAGLDVPASLTFVPVDFERQSLGYCLASAGFLPKRPAFFQWLGVVPYLTREAFSLTLDFIAQVTEAEVVFDYAEPFENYSAERREHVMAIADRAAARGEPWLGLYQPAEISEMLRSKGFRTVEDLGLAELTERFYGAFKQGIRIGPGGHVVWARQNV